ncbi:MAG: hypothetical protein AB7N65_12590 [Vicinamibacterales bacterium]
MAVAAAVGTKLGGYRGRLRTAAVAAPAWIEQSKAADQRAAVLATILARIDPDGTASLASVARQFNEEELPTPRGAERWTATSVARLKRRLAASGADHRVAAA